MQLQRIIESMYQNVFIQFSKKNANMANENSLIRLRENINASNHILTD